LDDDHLQVFGWKRSRSTGLVLVLTEDKSPWNGSPFLELGLYFEDGSWQRVKCDGDGDDDGMRDDDDDDQSNALKESISGQD